MPRAYEFSRARSKSTWLPNIQEKNFEAVGMSLKDLGLEVLKTEQLQAVESVVLKRKDVLAVLPTGFGKSLIYRVLARVFDYMC